MSALKSRADASECEVAPDHRGGSVRPVLRSVKSILRPKHMIRFTLLLGLVLFMYLTVIYLRWVDIGGEQQPRPAAQSPAVAVPSSDGIFMNVDESVLPAVVVRREDQVCALCTDGLVYVHVGRPPHATETVSAAPAVHAVTEVLQVMPATAPVFSAGSGPVTAEWPGAAEVVQRCVAQLLSLGLLGAAHDAAAVHNGTDPVVRASVVVDYDAEGGGVSVGRGGQCPAFLAEVRPVAASASGGTAKMDVSYPRLPSWPLRAVGGGVVGAAEPPYFGTARVLETDVDKDVQPPQSVELTDDRSGVVIRFDRDETSTKSEPFEMTCSSHFVSVFIGRFGRQHNQVQEMMHTLALSKRLSRTFIIPILMAESYIPYLRYDAQKLYGFNALRREGGYCLVSYEEARWLLKELEGQGEPMSLRRYNYYADPRPSTTRQWGRTSSKDWWQLSGLFHDGRVWYNVDAWLGDSKARTPHVTFVGDVRADGMNFLETEEEFNVKEVFPAGDEAQYVRMACMRRAVSMVVDQLGGDHVSLVGAKLQPRLAILSARMAFYAHPSLREQTLLMGLLRPADSIVKEADRLYAQMAPKLLWPEARRSGTSSRYRDTLRTGNFKHVIGYHIRRREGTCRNEGLIIDQTTYTIDPRFQLEKVDPSWSSPLSTLRSMELDCALNTIRVKDLYRQYTRWMRDNMTEDAKAAAVLVPTIYMAYDDQSRAIAEEVDGRLVALSRSVYKGSVWGRATAFPPHFVSAYDVRISTDFLTMFKEEYARFDAIYPQKTIIEGGRWWRDGIEDEDFRVAMLNALYDRGFKEMSAMAFDYFMLTNMGMFRGVALSSVSTNVVMRRWGRGLPCHGLLAGYQSSFYTPMWF